MSNRDLRFGQNATNADFSQCINCQHWQAGKGVCLAFPNGVPAEILTNEYDHHNPYPGDNGTQFQPKEFV